MGALHGIRFDAIASELVVPLVRRFLKFVSGNAQEAAAEQSKENAAFSSRIADEVPPGSWLKPRTPFRTEWFAFCIALSLAVGRESVVGVVRSSPRARFSQGLDAGCGVRSQL